MLFRSWGTRESEDFVINKGEKFLAEAQNPHYSRQRDGIDHMGLSMTANDKGGVGG